MKTTVILVCALGMGGVVVDYFYKLHKQGKVDLLRVYTYKKEAIPNKNMYISLENVVPSRMLTKVAYINQHINEIERLDPDFIFVAGWSQLLDRRIISASRNGTIGFHTSRLPRDRGRSTLAWQIAEGYKETAVTMFYISRGVDDGDVIGQDFIKIRNDDYISDVLLKTNKASYNLLATYFPLLIRGIAPRIKQDERLATHRRLRTDEDSCIDWNTNVIEIYNLTRAVAFPYPRAWTTYKGEVLKIDKATILSFASPSFYPLERPGTIIGYLEKLGYLIKTRDSVIAIKGQKLEGIELLMGEVLG